jgi:hypothetical protein
MRPRIRRKKPPSTHPPPSTHTHAHTPLTQLHGTGAGMWPQNAPAARATLSSTPPVTMEAGSWMKGPAPAADTGAGGSAAAGDGATGTGAGSGAGAGWKGGCTSGVDTGGATAGARSTIRGCGCSTTHKKMGQLVFAPLIQRARGVKVVTTRGIAATGKHDINETSTGQCME